MKVEGRGAPETVKYISKITDQVKHHCQQVHNYGLGLQVLPSKVGCRLAMQHQRSLQFTDGCRSLLEWVLLELQITLSV